MAYRYKEIIEKTIEYGGILDVMLALQEKEGYLTENAIHEISKAFQMSEAHVYDTASFYGMIHLLQTPAYDIRICRGAPCHVAGATEVIETIENLLDIKIGEYTKNGQCYFGYTECLGQCQSSPSLMINEKLYTNMTTEKITQVLKGEGII